MSVFTENIIRIKNRLSAILQQSVRTFIIRIIRFSCNYKYIFSLIKRMSNCN